MEQKLLISAKTKEGFKLSLSNNKISFYLVAFIQDTKEIWTLGMYYPCPYSLEEILNFILELLELDNLLNQTIENRSSQIIELITQETLRATNKERSLELLINKSNADLLDALDSKLDKNTVYTKELINEKLSGIYKVKGSRTFEELPIEGNSVGDVYNITNLFILNEKKYDLGTNVVWTEEGWDALAGIFDTSELEEDIQEVKDNCLTVVGRLDVLTEKTFKANAIFAPFNRTSTFSLIFRPLNKEDMYLTYSNEELKFGGANSLSKIYHEGNFNPSNYLPLSGGTLTGDLKFELYSTGLSSCGTQSIFPSSISRGIHDTSGNVYDKYYNDKVTATNTYANLIVKSSTSSKILKFGGDGSFSWDGNKVWHEGNDGHNSGLDADTLDGRHSSDFYDLTGGTRIPANSDLNDYKTIGTYYVPTNDNAETILNSPTLSAFTVQIIYPTGNDTYRKQILTVWYSNGNTYVRTYTVSNDKWSPWTLMITDLTNYTAPTATKLKTPIKLWGNDFDGSEDLNGRIVVTSPQSTDFAPLISAYNPSLTTGKHTAINLGYDSAPNNYAWLGFYYEGSHSKNNAIRLGIGGGNSDVITVNGHGNVGIGTADPQYKLDVNGSSGNVINISSTVSSNEASIRYVGTDDKAWAAGKGVGSSQDAFGFWSNTLGNNAMTLKSDGNVGIGTTNPMCKLDILNNNSGFLNLLRIDNRAYKEASIIFRGSDDKEWIVGKGTGSINDSFGFWSTSLSKNVVTLTNSGNVGIGTNDPKHKLDVIGAIKTDSLNITRSSDGAAAFNISNIDGTHSYQITNNGGAGSIVFATNSDSGTVERFRIHHNGNVGIGTNTPAYKLDVNGPIYSNDGIGLPNSKYYQLKDTNGASCGVLNLSEANQLIFGYGTAARGYDTYLLGNKLLLKVGTNNKISMYINRSGNVTIGESDLASTDYKLYVDGTIKSHNIEFTDTIDLKLKIHSDGRILYDIKESENGWARGIIYKKGDETLTSVGAYGKGTGLFYTYFGGAFDSPTLIANADKYIGIGTVNPLYKLDVNGTAAINGYTIIKDSMSVWRNLAVSNQIVSGDLVDWYGVSWSEDSSDPTCIRTGNMALHRSLPILSAMKGYYIENAIGSVPGNIIPLTSGWKLPYTSSTNNENDINPQWNGSIFIKIPEFWYIDDYEPSTKTHNLKISQTAKAGWCHHKEAYVGAYEGYDDGTYYKSIKNVIPTVSLTREQLRTKARANGYEDEYKWNIYTYEEHRAICHLFLVEYATRNSQAPVNTALTADGFKQGGLGSGCTTGTMNDAYSFIPTGTTDVLGNGSGQVAYTASNGTTYYANRYRGIENPFGHIWKHVDDIVNVYDSSNGIKAVYKCNKPEHFATNKNAKYKPLCSFPGGSKMVGWSKEIKATINCDFFKYSVGGSEATYWCDYNYDNDDTSEHCLLIGGDSGLGGAAGLFYFDLDAGVGYSAVNVGSRLTYLPWAE